MYLLLCQVQMIFDIVKSINQAYEFVNYLYHVGTVDLVASSQWAVIELE